MSCLNLLPQRGGWIADLAVRYETRLFPHPVLLQLQLGTNSWFQFTYSKLDLGRAPPGWGPETDDKGRNTQEPEGSTRDRPVGCSLTWTLVEYTNELQDWHGPLGTIDPWYKWHSTKASNTYLHHKATKRCRATLPPRNPR